MALGITSKRSELKSCPNPNAPTPLADSGFVQEERYAYTGGLLEFKPTPAIAVGVLGTWVRARLGRTHRSRRSRCR